MDKQAFIDIIKDGAIKAQRQFGICASLTLAQSILESGWGGNAPGNNLFGIKWTSGCGYVAQTLTTNEFYNGAWRTINAQFRSYRTLADSVYDHAQFIINNRRYSNLSGIKDYKIACKLIQLDGYATDPNYANQLIILIEENKLYIYDNQNGDVKKVKYLVVYGKKQDKPLAEVLAYKIGCPVMDSDILFDYSLVERTIAVGGSGTLPWSSYIKKEDVLTGKNNEETLELVAAFKLK